MGLGDMAKKDFTIIVIYHIKCHIIISLKFKG